MSTTAGYFDETTLLSIRARISELANFDSRVKLQYMPQIDSMNAILQNETTKITAIEKPGKDDTVEVEWINACGISPQSCTNCTFSGTQLSTNIKEYTLDLCQEVQFAVDDNTARSNDFDTEDFVAKGFMRADKELSEWANQQILTRINVNKGTNVFTTIGANRGCVSGNDTYITAPYWNGDLFALLVRIYQRNRFGSPYLLSGSNLHEAWLNANFKAGNDNGKGALAQFNSLDMYFDEVNFNATGLDAFTYLINRGTIAIANKARMEGYTEANPRRYIGAGEDRWSMTSEFSPLKYDVHYTNSCQTDSGEMLHSFKIILRMAVLFNPTGCDDNNTGILSLVCGACPS